VNWKKELIAGTVLLVGIGLAAVQPGFDPKDIVRQYRSGHSTTRSPTPDPGPLTPGLDDGEFLIDTSITYVGAPGYQFDPALAFDGANFLVTWEDYRSGSSYDIYAARVTPQGTVLDASGIPVSAAAYDQWYPAVAFDGANFLVTWGDHRSGYPDIYAARVTRQGTVLDPSGIPVSTAAYWQEYPALAFDGVNFLVTWHDSRNGYSDIYAARVTPQGTVLDTSGIPVSTAAYDRSYPAVVFDGANFLVTWTDCRSGSYTDIYAARVTPQGTVLDPNGIPVSTTADRQLYPALAFDGANSLVTWHDYRSGSLSDIYAARVTPQGTVLDPSGIPISTAASDQQHPAIAFDGANFLVTWADYRSGTYYDIYAARVTPQGAVLDPNGIPVSTAADRQLYPALAFDGANFLVTWEDYRSGSLSDIYAARVTPQGTVLDPSGIRVSTAAYDQYVPALAFDGANFLVTWQDYRSDSSWDVYAARVTPQGTVLDPSGIPVSTAADQQGSPAIAFDGANSLVVWGDGRSGSSYDIYAARVTPQGAVLDPNGIPVSTAADWQQYPALAFDGANFLVTWEDHRSGGCDIYAARVTPQGTVLDPNGIPVSTAADWQEYPAIAFDGANFLVTWTDYRGSSHDIYAARVTPQGTVLDPNGIRVSTAADDQEYPALAFDGANFLVAWQDWRSGSDYDIYAARVTPQGTVLDPSGIPVSTAPDGQWRPALAFEGANSLVTWQDRRSGASWDIYAARVTPAGVVFDTGPAVRQEGDQIYPALARGAGDQMFLVYQGWAGTVGGKTCNTDRIWGKFGPFPGIQETSKDEVRRTNRLPTIVRGVLFLPPGKPGQSTTGQSLVFLLDIAGRKVLGLHPGANDISRLSPGVYFVHQASAVERQAPNVHKLVIQK
jgi:hypothetical protein